MKKYVFILSFGIFILLSYNIFAKPIVAFGYLTNRSGNPNFNYMEIIFPNSFASAFEDSYDCTVIKPLKVNDLLEKKQLKLEKYYENYELPQISKAVDCDLFIFGYFVPLADNNIKIILTLYESGSNHIFTFTNIGKMETEIFRIIDRITLVLCDFFGKDNFFMFKTINKGSRIGLLTNLTPEELNSVYSVFMDSGYTVIALQGNELESYYAHDETIMNYFKYISTDDNSYDFITDWTRFKIATGTWQGKKNSQWYEDMRKFYEIYDIHYKIFKNTILGKYKTTYRDCDYVLIVVFNDDRSSCWVRAIDVNAKQLVFMHPHISAAGMGSDIQKTTRELIQIMQTPTSLPQKAKKQ